MFPLDEDKSCRLHICVLTFPVYLSYFLDGIQAHEIAAGKEDKWVIWALGKKAARCDSNAADEVRQRLFENIGKAWPQV